MMRKQAFLFLAMVVLASSVSMANLVGYWNFEEGSGTAAADTSGNARNGVLQANGGVYPQWVAGQVGNYALQLNASATSASNSNALVIANAPALTASGDAFTIAMWVRRDGIDTSYTFFPHLVYTNAYNFQLALDPLWTGDIDQYNYFGWPTLANSANRVKLANENTSSRAVGTWYHLAITYNAGMLREYINGAPAGALSAPAESMLSLATSLFIGTKADGSAYFNGAVDDLAIWAGTYLPQSEVYKLAQEGASPLTVADEAPLPANYFTRESVLAWTTTGWKLLGGPTFSSFTWTGENIIVNSDNTASVWWIKDISLPGWPNATMEPGGHYALWGAGHGVFFRFKDLTPGMYNTDPSRNVDNFGIAWIDPTWSGRGAQTAVFAPYITPNIALCMPGDTGYQEFNPNYGWTNKDYFKTYARVAAVNGAGASLRVRSYSYPSGTGVNPLYEQLTELGDVVLPLTQGDYQWQEIMFAYPKPTSGTPPVWTEISIVGGNANTRIYVDEFNPISDQANANWHTTTYKLGDFDEDSVVYTEDLLDMGAEWLESTTGMLDPRSGGLLVNGDFSADFAKLDPLNDNSLVFTAPTGWTFTGTVANHYGIQRVDRKGEMNYSWLHTLTLPAVAVPVGGNVAAYTTDVTADDPNGVLEQTVASAAVAGQTYYALAYVMTNTWYGWKDTATMSISVNGVQKASFVRRLSRNKWRALYGTYTAQAADAGKPIKISFAYANANAPAEDEGNVGNLLIGYAYLGTSMPNDWPEKRQNKLVNGGFEDLSTLQAEMPELYDSISRSDNWGAFFTADQYPATPAWVYEVPSGYSYANKAGMWACGYYAPPLPTPGIQDMAFYLNNDFVLGQVVGALNSGTTYYLDSACGVHTSEYSNTNWPNPAPMMRVELWRIPAGVTDGTVIYNAIASSHPSYVKVAEAAVASTGNISGGSTTYGTPASKWQIIGTTYTATAADTNMYVRVRGSGGVSYYPEYAFSDVYLSTQKRQVPGGAITFELSSGLQYDVLGPYNCYHGSLMGLATPDTDLNGDCLINLGDLAVLAGNWVDNWFDSYTGF